MVPKKVSVQKDPHPLLGPIRENYLAGKIFFQDTPGLERSLFCGHATNKKECLNATNLGPKNRGRRGVVPGAFWELS